MARMRRTRTLVGFVGFIPLLASLGCASFDGALCAVPNEIYVGLWAAIFGWFLGLTIRMWRERRAFEREASAA